MKKLLISIACLIFTAGHAMQGSSNPAHNKQEVAQGSENPQELKGALIALLKRSFPFRFENNIKVLIPGTIPDMVEEIDRQLASKYKHLLPATHTIILYVRSDEEGAKKVRKAVRNTDHLKNYKVTIESDDTMLPRGINMGALIIKKRIQQTPVQEIKAKL